MGVEPARGLHGAVTTPGNAGYAQHATLRRGDKIGPVSLPDLELAVEDLLPPLQEESE